MAVISNFDRMCAVFIANHLRQELKYLEDGGAGTVFSAMSQTFNRQDVERLEAAMRRRLTFYEKRAGGLPQNIHQWRSFIESEK